MHALADLILVVHFAFVLFVVAGVPAIWIGAACGWRWVRDWRFRIAHLAAICFVALESLGGMACPLTVWEDALRGNQGEPGFVARWLRHLLFYDFPDWVFTCAYLMFALLVAATWWLVPPRPARSRP